MRKGRWLEAAPSWVLGKNYIDLRDDPLNEDNYQELLRTLYGKREPPPPLGTPPEFSGGDGGKTKSKPVVPKKTIISKDTTAKFISNLKTIIAKLMPSFRLAGILVIISVVLLIGSWAISNSVSLIPTAKATATQHPTNTITPTIFLIQSPISILTALTPSETPQPSSTPTELLTLTVLPQVYDPHPMADDYHDAFGVSMRLVPAGEFTMGVNDGGGSYSPAHNVYLDAFYMDKYEVTNSLYKACVDTGGCTSLQRTNSYTHSSYYGNSQYDNYPVIYVHWSQAQTYCEWRDSSLPTEAQWEKAARGTEGYDYPWGNGIISCDRPDSAGCVGDTAKVGSYESGKSSLWHLRLDGQCLGMGGGLVF